MDIVIALQRPAGNHSAAIRVLNSLSRFDETPNGLWIELTPTGYRSVGDDTDLAVAEARTALLDIMPSTEANAKKEQELREMAGNLKRTRCQRALQSLLAEGLICRVGGGKRGDPYRYFRPDQDGSDDVNESEIPECFLPKPQPYMGRKNPKQHQAIRRTTWRASDGTERPADSAEIGRVQRDLSAA